DFYPGYVRAAVAPRGRWGPAPRGAELVFREVQPRLRALTRRLYQFRVGDGAPHAARDADLRHAADGGVGADLHTSYRAGAAGGPGLRDRGGLAAAGSG